MRIPDIDARQSLDFKAMTIDQLWAEAVRLAGILDLANDQRRQIFAMIEQRKAEAVADNRVRGMSTVQKDALRKALQ